jgi:hypothetical protein
VHAALTFVRGALVKCTNPDSPSPTAEHGQSGRRLYSCCAGY